MKHSCGSIEWLVAIPLLMLMPALDVSSAAERDSGRIGAAPDVAVLEPSDRSPVEAASSERTSPSRRQTLIASLTIFVLAIFVGFEIITKVPPTLHTPLMSGSNAISGVTLIGAVLTAGNDAPGWATFLGLLAMIFASINVVGGFLVTDRMLSMFKK